VKEHFFFVLLIKERTKKMKKTIKNLTLILTLLTLVLFVSCTKNELKDASIWDSATYTEDTTLGEGEKQIVIEIKAEEKTIELTVNTDGKTLGDALLENKIAEGDVTEFGLYIKKVNGISGDYEKDGVYWALYKDGEYLMTGADTTEITSGEHYELVLSK